MLMRYDNADTVCSYQSDNGRSGFPLVVTTGAQFEVEKQGVVGHQIQSISIHQSLAAQILTGLDARRVNPTCRGRETRGMLVSPELHSFLT